MGDRVMRPIVLFIGGLGRSGSTLLDLMLGQQPGFCAVGELSYIWERGVVDGELCGCGEPFRACPFWREVGDRAFGGWANVNGQELVRLRRSVDRNRFIPLVSARGASPRFSRRIARYHDAMDRLYEAISATAGGAVIVDSTKHVSTAFVVASSKRIDLRVVQLVRDSRGVAYSWTKTVRKPEVTQGDAYLDVYHPARIGARWIGYNALFHTFRLTSGRPSTFARYEDVVRRPRDELRRILSALDLPPVAELHGVDADSVQVARSHTIAGNPVRFSNERMKLRVDTEWRSRMPAMDRATVSAISLPLLAAYGYLGRDREPAGPVVR
jgi:hypothetical protein